MRRKVVQGSKGEKDVSEDVMMARAQGLNGLIRLLSCVVEFGFTQIKDILGSVESRSCDIGVSASC